MKPLPNTRQAACAVALILLVAVLTGCAGPGTSRQEADSSPGRAAQPVSLLFSISADGGTFEATEDGGYRLTLTGVDAYTIAFADRPSRDAAVIDTGAFIASWGTVFAGDGPNAVLVEHSPLGDADSTVVVLTRPVYDVKAGTLAYSVTVTTGEPPGRIAPLVHTPHAEVPGTFQDASLFIDAVTDNSNYDLPDDNGGKGYEHSNQE